MWLLWTWLGVAGAGLLALPSYGVYWRGTRTYGSYSEYGYIRKKLEGDDHYPEVDWWGVESGGTRSRGHFDDVSLPVALGVKIAFWPLAMAIYATMLSYKHSAKLLAQPGKLLIRSLASKRERDKFILDGEREVEKLLAEKSR